MIGSHTDTLQNQWKRCLMALVLGNYNNPVSYLDRQSRALMKLSVDASSFSTFSSRAAAAWTTSLARNRFLKPKCTANVCTRMSFILKKETKWTTEQDRYRLLQERSFMTLSPEFIGRFLNDFTQVLFNRHIHRVKLLSHLLEWETGGKQLTYIFNPKIW